MPENQHIEFVPLFVPLRQRLQMLVVVWHVFSIPTFLTLFMLFCALPPLWPLMIIYFVHLMWDDSPEDGSVVQRCSMRFRSLPVWRYFAEYFPVQLHVTASLPPAFEEIRASPSTAPPVPAVASTGGASGADAHGIAFELTSSDKAAAPDSAPLTSPDSDAPTEGGGYSPSFSVSSAHSTLVDDDIPDISDEAAVSWLQWLYNAFLITIGLRKQKSKPLKPTGKRYVFGYHPHGIIGMGIFAAIATEGCGWSKKFPNVPVSLLTLQNQFKVPFYREYLMGLGMASVSRRSCAALLQRGQSICIVIGGAQESLLARPGSMDLVLNKRKGFVKLAIRNNAALVPVIGFGENDIYDQVENDDNSVLYRLQTWMKRSVGFTIPLMHARGVFNYDVGIIPYRRPINVVVGEPMDVPHEEDPSPETVDEVHSLYMKHLVKLYNAHRARFNAAPVRIVE